MMLLVQSLFVAEWFRLEMLVQTKGKVIGIIQQCVEMVWIDETM